MGVVVDLENLHLDGLPRLHHVLGRADALVRQLGEVDQTLDPAPQVDEGPELADARDATGHGGARAKPASGVGRLFGFWEMLVYLGFVSVGLYYIVRKGVLNWSQDKADL